MTEEREKKILNTYLEVKNTYKTRQICHCGSKTMDRIMTKYNLHSRENTIAVLHSREKITDAQILEAINTMTRQEIADKYGVHVGTIEKRMHKLGVHALYAFKKKEKKKLHKLAHHRDRANKYGGIYEPGITLKKVYEKYSGVCCLCGKPTTNLGKCEYEGKRNEYPSIDHIIPLSKGGNHTWDNVQLAHLKCNVIKGSKLKRSV